MQLQITHTTHYDYSEPVDYALQKIRLRPLGSVMQSVSDWDIDISGGLLETSYRDHYGNHVDLVSMTPGAQSLSISARGSVETLVGSGVLGMVYGRAPLWHFREPSSLTQAGPALKAMAQTMAQDGDQLTELHNLSQAILAAVPYHIGTTDAATTAEEALSGARGVCQDHAQIFIACARLRGVPARYVSGYLMMNDRIDQDATHAWAEAHVDGLGWVGFDVSNGVSPDEKYVRIAIGCDARDAAPVAGMRMGPADERLIVSLQVQQ
jgi:transglutaminase-like putative cysteine protease